MPIFQRRGRLYGGIHILVAPPSEGKSYVVTAETREYLIYGKRKLYTNYPIRTRDGLHSSYYFDKSLMHENAIPFTINSIG